MGGGELFDLRFNHGSEAGEVGVVATVESTAFEELPQAFDEVGGVAGQEFQVAAQLCGEGFHGGGVLILGVVQHQRDRAGQTECGDLAQQFAHRVGVDRGRVEDRHQLVRDGVPRSQHIQALATCRRFDEDAGDAPQAAQERSRHEVTGIHEEHVAPAWLGGVECRLPLVFDEGRLVGEVFLQLFLGGAGIARIRRDSSPSRCRWCRT